MIQRGLPLKLSLRSLFRKDISVPGPLQCSPLTENLADVVSYDRFLTNLFILLRTSVVFFQLMWFSSGGTKSVVHTDQVDNINCLIRGEKSFVMVDSKYKEFVPLDRTNGTFSSLDVDR